MEQIQLIKEHLGQKEEVDENYLTSTVPQESEDEHTSVVSEGSESVKNKMNINDTVLSHGSMKRVNSNTSQDSSSIGNIVHLVPKKNSAASRIVKDANQLSIANKRGRRVSLMRSSINDPKDLVGSVNPFEQQMQVTSGDFNSKQSYNLNIDDLYESTALNKKTNNNMTSFEESHRLQNMMELSTRQFSLKRMNSINQEII